MIGVFGFGHGRPGGRWWAGLVAAPLLEVGRGVGRQEKGKRKD